MMHEVEHVLHFERGILFTVKALLTKPGQSVREFILQNRRRLVKPIIFIIITSLIYTLVNHFFHIEGGYVNFDGIKSPATAFIFTWIQDHYGYANIIMGMFVAIWLKVFFRKYDYNFFEILILLCFVMGMEMLMFSVFALFEGLTKINFMEAAGVIGICYCTWAIGQFFDKKKPINYLKALISYALGMFAFAFSALLSGLLIDVIVHR